MSIFTKISTARIARTADSQKIVYIYAFILLVFVVCQLFKYDDFIRLIESFWLPGGLLVANLMSCLIVISELFALPFLLRMDLSHLMRAISMALSWLAPTIWLFLTLWINLTINAISNVGFFGSLVRLTPGWWAVFMSVALCLLAAWSSWGLWPTNNRKMVKQK